MVGEIGSSSQKKSNIVLKIVLFLLIAAVFALVVVILVLKINEESDGAVEEEEYSYNNEIYNDGEEILLGGEVSGGNENAPISIEYINEAMTYYDEQLSKATDPETIFIIKSTRISLLIDHGLYDEALKYLNMIDTTTLNMKQLSNIYFYYMTVFNGLGQMEESKNYEELYQKTVDKINEEIYEEQKQISE